MILLVTESTGILSVFDWPSSAPVGAALTTPTPLPLVQWSDNREKKADDSENKQANRKQNAKQVKVWLEGPRAACSSEIAQADSQRVHA